MKLFFQQLGRIWPYFKPLRSGFITAAIGMALVAASEPAMPWLLQQVLDVGFKKDGLPLWWVPVGMIGVFALRGLATFTANYALSWTALRGTEALRGDLFRRLLDAHPRLFIDRPSSSLINTVAYEVQSGAQQLSMSCLDLVRDTLTLLALIGYLLWLNWQLTLFVTVLLPAVALVMRTMSRRLHRLTLDGQVSMDRMGYVVEENVLAWRTVRMHGAQAGQSARFNHESLALRRLALKSTAAASVMTPITQILSATALSAVMVTALWQARAGVGSVGGFVGFVTAMLMLVAPIKRLSEIVVPITRGMAALNRAIDLLHVVPREQGGDYRCERAQGRISLQGVSVQYRADAAPALSDICLDIPAGRVVALVGPSGAGKTTLINLLPRFVDISAGSLQVDGHEVRDWDVASLRSQFALVSQDVVLFNDSVAANVALGGELDTERVRAALQAANLLQAVEAMPEGMHSMVGHNGQQLSGGQRQRLAIARAIYKNAPILILDEATSALDSESERLVQGALERLMQGRTAIVIAHRLSTIERADHVVVVDGGRIVEQGSHAELLARGGLFARLHALQFHA
jgi:subfamily B ATP-binding cassette protein MsbA